MCEDVQNSPIFSRSLMNLDDSLSQLKIAIGNRSIIQQRELIPSWVVVAGGMQPGPWCLCWEWRRGVVAAVRGVKLWRWASDWEAGVALVVLSAILSSASQSTCGINDI